MGLFGNVSYSRSTEPVFYCNGVLSEKVKAVFTDLGVSVDTLAQANEFAQKNLLRSGERWDKQEETPLYVLMHKNQAALIDDVRALGMIDAVNPTEKAYTYALVVGATKKAVMARLDYLAELITSGYGFNYIVLLGGERKLRDIEKEGLPETITTEAQMMEYVCAQYPTFANQKIIPVNAPIIQKADGTFTRLTADSTLIHFAHIAPQDGSCLVISHNPYNVRVTKVAQRVLDQSRFPTQGAGRALQEGIIDIFVIMDEFARTIYEENVRFTAGK
jgi:hypothetical protein